MKRILIAVLFTLATLAWAAAQQPGSMPQGGTGQATSPSSQVPDTDQSPSTAGSASQAGQSGAQATPPGQAGNAPVTEGCLGGSDGNYTLTDKTGTTYKLNIPAGADTSKLAAHVGESVNVAGNVNDAGAAGSRSIDVHGIGRGTGNCAASGTKSPQTPPKR